MPEPVTAAPSGERAEPADERFRLLVESVIDYAIFLLDPQGRVSSWNAGAERLKGYTASEIIGQQFSRFYTPEDRERGHPAEMLRRATEAGRHADEGWRLRKDGSRFWASVTLTALRDPNGVLLGFAKVTRDLTERREAELALRAARDELDQRVQERTAELTRVNAQLRRRDQQLSDLVETAPIGMHSVDEHGTILWANQAALRIVGYRREEYVGRNIAEFHVDPSTLEAIMDRLGSREPVYDVEMRLRARDGSIRHVLLSSTVLWEEGQFVHTRCFMRDVTVEKRSEALLRGQQAVLEMMVRGEGLPDVLESAARLVEELGNGALCSILYLDEEGRLRHGAAPSLPPDYNAAIDGLPIGPKVGSCGTAAFRRQPVVVTDIAADPLWRDFAPLALSHELRACWSTPICASDGSVLGTVAMYAREPRGPSPDDLQLTGIATRLAGIAIERARSEEALRHRAEELAQRDRQKDEFLAMLAHELRNPLAPIINASQVLKARASDDPLLRRQQQVIDGQSRHMARLLDDLLEVSRITQGKIELRKQVVEVATTAEQAVETARPQLEVRRHRFVLELPEAPLWVEADPTRLLQVIGNLLTNAAKYTPPAGEVRLQVVAQSGAAFIRVSDTGVGIDSAFLPRIFDLFTQGDRSLGRTESGLGIGLTMVKRLVELHGGEVTAASPGRGQGSVFEVRWPALPAGAAPDAPEASPAAAAPLAETARRVLIVDDNRDAAETLADLVGLWGHQVTTAFDGMSALRLIPEIHPEVVLLDISMPGMDGFEVARRLRADPAINGLRLIALTGYGQAQDRERALAAGFHHHLTKPVEPGTLRALLAGSSEATLT